MVRCTKGSACSGILERSSSDMIQKAEKVIELNCTSDGCHAPLSAPAEYTHATS
jgi:hypothetical protein